MQPQAEFATGIPATFTGNTSDLAGEESVGSTPILGADATSLDESDFESAAGDFETAQPTTEELQSAVDEMADRVNQITTATKSVKTVLDSISGASPLERIDLLETLQRDPDLQKLVTAGLFHWNEIVVPNTDGPNQITDPDGGVPKTRIDFVKLQDLQKKLQQQQTQDITNVRVRRQSHSRTGPKASTRGYYRDMKVWTGPKRLPGDLPNKQNVST